MHWLDNNTDEASVFSVKGVVHEPVIYIHIEIFASTVGDSCQMPTQCFRSSFDDGSPS